MQCYNCNSARLLCDTQKDAYICQDCGYEYPKQYFFISHSHKDIEKVRIVRNIVEETFFYEPILFFLKCVSEKTELENLIEREISERIWFVYCNSKNAEQSEYVQFERQYLDKLLKQGKKFNVLTVELDKFDIWDERCADYIREQIAYKIRKTKIFLSSTPKDFPVVKELTSLLVQNGYSVWNVEKVAKDVNWELNVGSAIREHSYKDGLVISLVNKDFVFAIGAQIELETTINKGATILPILVVDRLEEKEDILNSFYSAYSDFKYCVAPPVIIRNKVDDSIVEILKYIESI